VIEIVARRLALGAEREGEARSAVGFKPGSLSDLPRSGLRTQPGVLTPGTHPTRRAALKVRKVKFVITSEMRFGEAYD